MNEERILVVMAKAPLSGKTKTRFCPPLTLEEAATLSEAFLLDAIELSQRIPCKQRFIAHDEDVSHYFLRFEDTHELIPSTGKGVMRDFAAAMWHCFQTVHRRDQLTKVLFLHSDCPTISEDYLRWGFEMMDACPVVIGPSTDGGYSFIGMREPLPWLFMGIDPSSPTNCSDTIALACRMGYCVGVTPFSSDVDDLKTLLALKVQLEGIGESLARHTREILHGLQVI